MRALVVAAAAALRLSEVLRDRAITVELNDILVVDHELPELRPLHLDKLDSCDGPPPPGQGKAHGPGSRYTPHHSSREIERRRRQRLRRENKRK